MTGDSGDVQIARADRLAEAISNIFHPFVVAIPTMVIAMVWKGTSLQSALFWTILAVCVVIVPMLFLIYRGVRSGRYSDASISIREQRRGLYAAAAILFALLLAILIWGKAPTILLACLLSALAANVIASFINHQFTKLSLHSVGMAGYATVLLLTAPALGTAMVLFALLVGWARMRLNHHKLWQILIGWAVSSGCVLLVFWILRLL
ncbi:MAG: phosphatase PAP2 family protein [Chloroflexi bacterium]|nr:phosphatase PAP2 family protein [Chloroflexota bacterium]